MKYKYRVICKFICETHVIFDIIVKRDTTNKKYVVFEGNVIINNQLVANSNGIVYMKEDDDSYFKIKKAIEEAIEECGEKAKWIWQE